jgi:CRISPR-associated protein (Cas_Cas02710)
VIAPRSSALPIANQHAFKKDREEEENVILLILTVGTGTAGRHSDVAAGLARTIDLVAPRRFWLVPSQSEKSLPVADIIRESVQKPGAFSPWSETERYHAIADPDDIHQCRQVLREVIAVAMRQLQNGERLIVNPTSGTKQMSAGATLAALDEEIGELMFTVGERVDGVVKTGTEQPKSFLTEAFFLERDLRIAQSLFDHGAFYAAARILRRYGSSEALRARETALCLHEWQRMNYAKAASHASRFSEELRSHLKSLAEADTFSPSALGEPPGWRR